MTPVQTAQSRGSSRRLGAQKQRANVRGNSDQHVEGSRNRKHAKVCRRENVQRNGVHMGVTEWTVKRVSKFSATNNRANERNTLKPRKSVGSYWTGESRLGNYCWPRVRTPKFNWLPNRSWQRVCLSSMCFWKITKAIISNNEFNYINFYIHPQCESYSDNLIFA